MTDIHDIKPALAVGPDLQWLWWMLALLALLGVTYVGWRLWRRRKQVIQEKPALQPLAPELEALQALEALAANSRMAAKDYYFRLSAVLRRYMERRYGFPAEEMTSEELLPVLRRLDLETRLYQEVQCFCSVSDLIKFAGAPAAQRRMQEDLGLVRRFVDLTSVKEAAQEEQEQC